MHPIHVWKLMARRFRHGTAFALVTILTLALSLGAAATMFTVINSFLLSALPYEDADQLVMIWTYGTTNAEAGTADDLPLSPGAFVEIGEQVESIGAMAAFLPEALNVTLGAEARRLPALFVTGEFFDLLGVQAQIGRTLGPEDEMGSSSPVVVSHRLWQEELGGVADLSGTTLSFGGGVHDVVGVLPPDFRFSESLTASNRILSKPVDVWAPFGLDGRTGERGFHYLNTIARLEPGTGIDVAREELGAYTEAARNRYPETDGSYELRVVGLRDQIFGHLRPVLLTLGAATGCLLLIACLNLATLLMARMRAARAETAVRLALGASRRSIVTESLVDTLSLSILGGTLAIGLAHVATRLLIALQPVSAFGSYPPEVELRVILFTLVLSFLAGLLFGTGPAIWASRVDTATGLGEGSSRTSPRSRFAFSALVTTEISLATALLIAMGLALVSFQSLVDAELGVDVDGIVTFDLHLAGSEYRDPARKVAFFDELLTRIEAIPGVESTGMNYALPFSGVDPSNGFEIVGRPSDPGENLSANLALIDPGYFETLGIPLLEGRRFRESDDTGAAPVAIIDRTLRERYFGQQDPLGRRLTIASDEQLTIVGVVDSVRQEAIDDSGRPFVYLPYRQRSYQFASLAIATRMENPLDLAPAIREVTRELDPAIPLSNFSTLEHSYLEALAPQRFSFLTMSIFALMALFLTLVGVYGVMSFLIRQRKREAGVRLALGASPRKIAGLVFRQGFLLSILGVVIGCILAISAGRALESLAYGVETFAPDVFALVALIVLSTTFLAYYPPARALSKVDPNVALRGA